MEHPPYSLDLTPCDYNMFGPLEKLEEHRLDKDCDVGAQLAGELSPFFYYGIKELPIR